MADALLVNDAGAPRPCPRSEVCGLRPARQSGLPHARRTPPAPVLRSQEPVPLQLLALHADPALRRLDDAARGRRSLPAARCPTLPRVRGLRLPPARTSTSRPVRSAAVTSAGTPSGRSTRTTKATATPRTCRPPVAPRNQVIECCYAIATLGVACSGCSGFGCSDQCPCDCSQARYSSAVAIATPGVGAKTMTDICSPPAWMNECR